MVHRIVFWTGFGLATRAWQLGIEMRPFFNKSSLWVYPVFGAAGASFGYWLEGVDERQTAVLTARKEAILEKRARQAQQIEQTGVAA
ncbi:NADH-ubiquinone oxidoreductase [Niveomyces insectorum RCEF 264]|uniref:NADH-ubiquinone oxidoreductase n=1 Tax=Niveomyces insectorum RCEF 264 TaxID=1081102 RepID=A0A167YYJ2_9HYPO|nr:NADH-ubiquinone oxidoreductase [Niveomyces insectorum RCEF 264]